MGAVASAIPTIWIAKKQLSAAFDNTKLETLQKKIEKLESLLASHAAVKTEFGLGHQAPQEMVAKAMVAFTEKAALARQCYHYLPEDLAAELDDISRCIGGFFFLDKTGQQLNTDEVNAVFERQKVAEPRLLAEISTTLRVWQAEVEYLTVRK